MKSLLSLLLLAIFAPACLTLAQQPVDSRQREIVFRSVNVVPMDEERILENQDVVIKDGKIAAMGASNSIKFSSAALVIEAKGKFLIPGLAEMHAHVPPVDDILHPGITLSNFNAIVKTANEVHIPFAGHVSWEVGIWRAIAANYASIDHMDGFIEGLVPDLASMTEDQTGFIGVFVAGRADSTQIPKLTKALAEHRIGVVPTQALAERWFAADKTTAQLLKAPEMMYIEAGLAGKWAEAKDKTMTNALYKPATYSQFIKLRRKLIFECQKNGVVLLLGSDAPQVFNVPGFSIHHELQYLVNAGLTPYQALRTGTVNPALYFNRADAGTIKTGNVSDLVLLNGNPLKDISQSGRIEGVMLAYRWLPKDYIAGELKKLVKK